MHACLESPLLLVVFFEKKLARPLLATHVATTQPATSYHARSLHTQVASEVSGPSNQANKTAGQGKGPGPKDQASNWRLAGL